MRQTSPAPPRSLLFKAHAVAWSLAGAASAAYLGWAMLLPSSPSGYAIHSNVGHSNVGPAAAARRFDALHSQLSGDVRAIHTKLAASEDTTHVLLGRVAALEEKSAFVAAAIQGPTASIPPSTFAVERVEGKPPAARTTSGTADITTGAILQKTAAAPVLFPPLAAGGPPAPIATTAASSSADGASAPPLPKASLGLADLTTGTRFGLGMAINDGDQLTPGQRGWGGLAITVSFLLILGASVLVSTRMQVANSSGCSITKRPTR